MRREPPRSCAARTRRPEAWSGESRPPRTGAVALGPGAGQHRGVQHVDENRFLAAAANPLSTFSIDVDAASYSNVRRFLSQGTLPPKDAVRIEELVNYFPYDYADHSGRDPFAVTTEVGAVPLDARAPARPHRPAGPPRADARTCRRATWSS